MKKNKLFLLLTLSCLLFSCGNTSNSSFDSSPSENSSTNENILSNRNELKAHLENKNDSIKTFKVEKNLTNSYGSTTTINTFKVENNEVTILTTISSEDETTSSTEYYGLIEDTLYELYISSPASNFDYVTRTKYSEDNLESAKEDLNNLILENNFTSFINDSSQGLGNYFNENNEVKVYRVTTNDDGVTIHSKVNEKGVEYMLISNFDSDLNIKDITFNKTGYNLSDWDEKNNEAKSGATSNYTHSFTISEFTYGRETASKTSISFDGYFIESLTGEVNLYTSHFDLDTMKSTKSEANKLFTDSLIETTSLFSDGLTFTPETALDQHSITITSSSNDNAVYQDENGNWLTSSTVGEKAILTLGNSFNQKMISVEVEIVEFSSIGTGIGSISPVAASITEWGILQVSTSTWIWTPSLTMEIGTSDIYALPTDNEGPFKDLDKFSFTYSNSEICKMSVSEMNLDLGGYSAWFIYFDINAKAIGNTSVTIKLDNKTMWALDITVTEVTN